MKNNIFKFFIFITLTLQINSSFAVELKLDDIKNKINDIKNSKEVVSGSPQFQMLSVLEDITNEPTPKGKLIACKTCEHNENEACGFFIPEYMTEHADDCNLYSKCT